MAVDPYLVGLALAGASIIGVSLIPRYLSDVPLSVPIIFLVGGAVVFRLPLGLTAPDPLSEGVITEKLTELGVIVALMGAGLKIDRPIGLRRWRTTWRLLAITMPLTIAGTALLGWGIAGFTIPTAMLLGAVIAPTDPVLASEVQVEEPMEFEGESPVPNEAGRENEVRFALTSEAGLNDGLAFPFTYLAVLMATAGVAPGNWAGQWTSYYVAYKVGVGILAGLVGGWILAKLVFSVQAKSDLARAVEGLEALGGTLFIYGLAELIGGYGFLAVFVAALGFRHYERDHGYNETLHAVAEKGEHVLMVVIMLLFGGAIATGLLAPLTIVDIVVGTVLVLVVRPAAGVIGLVGYRRDIRERGVISFFGIRGIGSFFYLSYGLNQAAFTGETRIWALVGFVVLLSVVLHGVTASPAVDRFTRGGS